MAAVVSLTAVLANDSVDDPAPTFDPFADPIPVANWALSFVHRERSDDGLNCHWTLAIGEAYNETRTVDYQHCQFNVTGTEDVPCDVTQFSRIPCSPLSEWVFNAGYSKYGGFTVMVVTNTYERAKAYFGLNDEALNKGALIPMQIQCAYPDVPPPPLATRTLRDDAMELE
jgi:hypothetical protein